MKKPSLFSTLFVHNTLSDRLEPFTSSDDTVRLYVCGITPYDDAHLGHGQVLCYL